MLSSPNNPFLSGKLRFFLILFIVADLAISFNQYYDSPIDGDVTSIVLPTAKYKAVLKDPCGIEMNLTIIFVSDKFGIFFCSPPEIIYTNTDRSDDRVIFIRQDWFQK